MTSLQSILLAATCLLAYAWTPDTPAKEASGSYILGPNDQISVDVIELPELNGKSYRIDSGGSVSLPLVGRLQAAGMTLTQFEEALTVRLKTQVRNPHLVTGLIETRSQPVSVMGLVSTPGTQQLSGSKTLFDVLSMAGGLKPEAGDVIKITRVRSEGPLPLPQAVEDPVTGTYTAEVNVRDVVELRDQKANILVRPHDAISVSRAQVIYVVGDVHKPGGFPLAQRHTLSAVEALSLAEGPTVTASTQHARILRVSATGNPIRDHIPIDLKKILAGKAPDIQLQAEDVLFVPDNTVKRATTRAAETALSTLSGLIIWGL
ncbi:MAG: polysaccharide export protein [Bryobacterales bacterium]|jgi:polysaccharide export outer membrane protein|nr:polysaccharide export protein [Bryobacterales bacterium]